MPAPMGTPLSKSSDSARSLHFVRNVETALWADARESRDMSGGFTGRPYGDPSPEAMTGVRLAAHQIRHPAVEPLGQKAGVE
jgi:hypothetical protein